MKPIVCFATALLLANATYAQVGTKNTEPSDSKGIRKNIQSLDCSEVVNNGKLTAGVPASGVTTVIPYMASNSKASVTYNKNGGPDDVLNDIDITGYYHVLGNWGLRNTVNEPFGNIAETIIYNSSSLSEEDNAKVESYLAIKYGITLDQTARQSYINSSGTKIYNVDGVYDDFDKDIIVIGQDDKGSLDQRISKSMNAGSILTLAKDNDFTSANNSSVRTSLGDGNFLVTGHNGRAITFTEDFTNSDKANKRMMRTWAFDETGTVGNVHIAIKTSDLTLPDNTDNKLYAILSTDQSFDGSDSAIEMTKDGDYWSAEVDPEDGDFMSFAVLEESKIAPGGILSDLSLWFKADMNVNETSGVVDNWTDVVSNIVLNDKKGNDATNTDPQLVSGVNGANYNPHVVFDGNDFIASEGNLVGLDLFNATNNTVFFVKRVKEGEGIVEAGFETTFGGNGFTRAGYFYRYTEQGSGFGTQDASHEVLWSVSPEPILNQYVIARQDVNSTEFSTFVNGVSGSTPATYLPLTHSSPSGRFSFATRAFNLSTSDRVEIDIAEYIAFKRDLSAMDMQKVESYLAIKYGITLSQTTAQSYINSSGTEIYDADGAFDAFDKDIIGIGQDDNGSLDQRISKSVNAGSILILSNDADFTSANNTAGRTSLGDGNFLVTGHNSGAVEFNETFDGNDNSRMPRIWAFDETGTVGNVHIAMETSDLTLPDNTDNKLYVVLSTDQSFDSSNSMIEMTKDGDYWSAEVDPADGDFMSFAVLEESKIAPGGILSDLSLWFKADMNVNETSGVVDNWTDVVSNIVLNDKKGNDATNTDPQLVSGVNGANYNPHVVFDGNDFIASEGNLVGLDLFNATNNTVFFVKRVKEGEGIVEAGFETTFGGNGFTRAGYFYRYTEQGSGFGTQDASHEVLWSVSHEPILNQYVIARQDVNSTEFSTFVNGVSGSTPATYLPLTHSSPSGRFSFATRAFNLSTSDRVEIDIAEYIAFKRDLSAMDMQKVESYLAIKYGITLSQTTAQSYINSSGTEIYDADGAFDAFDKDIIGIGQDDNGSLDQRISKSVNAGSILILSNDADFTSANNTAGRTSLGDGNFLVTGHNSGAVEFNETFDGNDNSRMPRIWAFDETGTVGNVHIAMETSDLTLPDNTDNKLYVVLSTDQSFDSSNSMIEMTKDGDYWSAEVDPADGDFMSFAVLEESKIAPGGILSDLSLWFKADMNVNETSGVVDNWTDVVSNIVLNDKKGNDATNTDPQLVSGVNGANYNPHVVFDGNDFIASEGNLVGLDLFNATNNTVFFVKRVKEGEGIVEAGFETTFGGNGFTRAGYFYRYTEQGSGFGTQDASHEVLWSVSHEPILNQYVIARQDVNSTEFSTFVNGVSGSTPATYLPLTHSSPSGRFSFATRAFNLSTSDRVEIDIAEYIAFKRDLSAMDMQKVESYLAIKYGITLSQTTAQSYINSSGTEIYDADGAFDAFDKDIIGIGQDDNGSLDQRISKSVNAGSILILSNDADFTSANNTAGRTSLGDGNFLVTGHNGGAIEFNETFDGNDNSRMPRIWAFDETGTVGNVHIAMETSDLTLPDNTDNKLYVVLSTDQSFDGSDSAIEMTKDGDYWSAEVDPADGQFMSFAVNEISNEFAPGGVSNNIIAWLKSESGTNTTTDGEDVTQWNNSVSNPVYNLEYISSMIPYDEEVKSSPPSYESDGDNLLNFHSTVLFRDIDGEERQRLYIPEVKVSDPNTNLLAQTIRGSTVYFIGMPNGNYKEFWGGVKLSSHAETTFSTVPFVIQDNNTISFWTNTGNIVTPYVSNLTWGNNEIAFAKMTVPDADNGNITYNKNGGVNHVVNDVNINGYYQAFGNYGLFNHVKDAFGNIAETVIYNSPTISDADNAKIESYLAIKYGITLDQTTPQSYINSLEAEIYDADGVYDAFDKNIIGIGQDDNGSLDQRISKSVNAGSILILSNDTDFTSANNTAGRTSLGDGNFLVTGHNGGAIEFTEALANSEEANKRMPRIWAFDETGTVGNIHIAMKTSDVTLTDNTDNKLYVVLSADQSFDGSDSVIEMINDGDYWSAEVDPADGDFMSFAVLEESKIAPGGILSDLSLWFKADMNVNETSGVVDNWTDVVSNIVLNDKKGNDATNTDPQLVSGVNGANYNPHVVFDGNDFIASEGNLVGLDLFNATNNTVFFVKRVKEGEGIVEAGFETTFGGNGFTRAGYFYRYTEQGSGFGTQDASHEVLWSVSPEPILNQYVIARQDVNSTEFSTFVNGISGSTPATYLPLTHSSPSGRFSFATRAFNLSTSDRVEIDIAEYIAFKRDLSAMDMQKVESYLAIKYGITLNQTTAQSYINSSGTEIYDADGVFDAFDKDIIGIGQDDNGSLDQRISKSVNAGSILILSNDADFTSANNTAGRTSLGDGNFLVTGHNGGAIEFTEALANSEEANKRMPRIWAFDETGTVGNIHIAIKTSDLTLPDNTDNKLYAILSTDKTFGGLDPAIEMTKDGDYWSAEVDPADGDFMSFAVLEESKIAPGGILSDLSLWFKADMNVNETSGVVDNWTDVVSNIVLNDKKGNDATNTDPQLVSGVNGANYNPHVVFDGNDFIASEGNLVGLDLFNATNNTVFFVKRVKEGEGIVEAGFETTFGGNGFTRAGYFYRYTEQGSGFGTQDASHEVLWSVSPEPILNQYVIARQDVNSTEFSTFVNGVSGSTPATYLPLTHSSPSGRFSFATRAFNLSTSDRVEIDIAEYIAFKRDLSAMDVQKVESYLAIKYGITLSQTTAQSYINSSGTEIYDADGAFDAFDKDIIGIGQDDNGSLDQRISKSVNAGSILILSNDADFTSANNTAGRTSLGDGNFLVTGHNGGAIEFTEALANSEEANKRMMRTWAFDETGTVGNVHIAMKTSDLTLPDNTDNKLYAILSTDQSFGSLDPAIEMTNDGSYWSAEVDPADGQFMSFAIKEKQEEPSIDFVALATDYNLYYYKYNKGEIANGVWEKIPGTGIAATRTISEGVARFQDFDMISKNNIVATHLFNRGHNTYRWDGERWMALPVTDRKTGSISIAHDGAVFAAQNNKVYYLNGDQWTILDISGPGWGRKGYIHDIDAFSRNEMYASDFYENLVIWNGSRMYGMIKLMKEGGGIMHAYELSVGKDRSVFVCAHNPWRSDRKGIYQLDWSDELWIKKDVIMDDIINLEALTSDKLVAVDVSGKVYFWDGTDQRTPLSKIGSDGNSLRFIKASIGESTTPRSYRHSRTIDFETVSDFKNYKGEIPMDKVVLYPNPANNKLHIRVNKAIRRASVEIYSMDGNLVYKKSNLSLSNGYSSISNLESLLSSGNYVIKIRHKKGIISKIIIKE